MMENEIITFLTRRKVLYQLLANLFLIEPDREMVSFLLPFLSALMSETDFSTAGSALESQHLTENDFFEGLQLMIDDLSAMDKVSDLDELAADYAHIFLAAGDAIGTTAFPYESAYLSYKRVQGQAAEDTAPYHYHKNQLSLTNETYQVPEDHVGLAFDYMAFLCEQALTEKDSETDSHLELQKTFFQSHIINWAPGFLFDTIKYASTGFYKGLGKITLFFLELESYFFRNL